MPKYTTADDLAKYLGRVFDNDQNSIADLCIDAAEVIVERKAARRYALSTSQTLTLFQPPSPLVVLPSNGPYSAISVIGYSEFGNAGFPLVLGAQYEIRDAAKGILWFPDAGNWYRLDIAYTPTGTILPNIKLATNIMAAHWMRPILNDEIPGLANYSVGSEFAITFNQFVQESGYPPEVDTLLGVPALYIA